MAITLFGLISLQFYWVKNDIRLKEQEFSKNVNEALRETARENQRMITTNMLKDFIRTVESEQGSILIINEDTIHMPAMHDFTDDFKIFFEQEDGFFHDLDRWKSTEANRNWADPWSLNLYAGPEPEELEFLQKVLTKLAGELSELSLNFEHQVNISELNRIFRQKLHERGIDLDYQLAVINPAKNKMFCTSARMDKQKLLRSEYHVNLFPSRFISGPTFLQVYFPHKFSYLMSNMWLRVVTAFFFIGIIIFSFAFTIWTIFRQKKLSLMKNDFINNMTHEFKTPITTISLAGQAITDPDVSNDSNRLKRFGNVILEESRKLSNQVEKILQMAILDRTNPNLKNEVVNMHEVIENLVSNYKMRFHDKQVFTLDLQAQIATVKGDQVHLTNVIDNLIDNAVKYSCDIQDITIRTRNEKNYISISISDKGIGMSKEELKMIFERFYRVHTGNVHDVKGFGLGLTYVKTMLDAHGGKINVKSEPGKGSTFEVLLPITNA